MSDGNCTEVRRLTVGPVACNCYLLTDTRTDTSWVVDPGGFSPQLKEALGEANIEKILLTHGHYDHTGGLAELYKETKATVCLCEDEMHLYRDPARSLSGSREFTERLPEVGCILNDGDTLTLGDAVFTVYHTPGHTPGSVVFRGEELLFTGDTLFEGSVGRTDLPGGSPDELTRSLRRISAMPGNLTVYPGHGPRTTMAAQLRSNPFLQGISQ